MILIRTVAILSGVAKIYTPFCKPTLVKTYKFIMLFMLFFFLISFARKSPSKTRYCFYHTNDVTFTVYNGQITTSQCYASFTLIRGYVTSLRKPASSTLKRSLFDKPSKPILLCTLRMHMFLGIPTTKSTNTFTTFQND